MTLLASPAGIVRRASRVPSPFPARGEGTRDARLRMSAGEAMTLLSNRTVIAPEPDGRNVR